MECNMPVSARKTASFARLQRSLALSSIFFAILLAAVVGGPGDADARGAYDGTWNVTFTPQQGNCHHSHSAPFIVAGSQVKSAGGGKVSGGIRPNGAVSVRLSVGLSFANGTGRLAGRSGSGRWSGVITGDQCSGVWQATRG
jgi:hypothetical protein